MQGSPIPAANLTLDGVVQAIVFGLLQTADANHWFVVPPALYAAGGAIGWLAAHGWDYFTGDNKKPA
jgi:hypothetical protein